MIRGSSDLESIPRREVREYHVERGSVYIQTRQYDKEGNLEKEIWERKSSENKTILDDAGYLSKESFDRLTTKRFKPRDILKIAKSRGYAEIGGFIIWNYKNFFYLSSKVTKIEPPLEEEVPINA